MKTAEKPVSTFPFCKSFFVFLGGEKKMDNHIVLESSLWDLHIHTCDCPKASGDFKGMSVSDYIDKLVEIFRKYSDLSLISFTDHNHISKRVYDEFESRKTGISVLPGIECDVFLDKETKDKDAKGFKHVRPLSGRFFE